MSLSRVACILTLGLALGACAAPTAESLPTLAESSESLVSTSTTTTTTTQRTLTTPPTTTTQITMPPSFTATVREVTVVRLGHSWREGCPVTPDDLRLISLTHWGFDGGANQGDLIVHEDHAEAIAGVFETLFEIGYPIDSIVPIGDLPMDAESAPGYSNTSGFHCRVVAGTDRWSEHARGLAVDLNPHLNPLVSANRIEPSGATRYVDRTLGEPGMITDDGSVVEAFAQIGWSWGGNWQSLKDYHHFSATGR